MKKTIAVLSLAAGAVIASAAAGRPERVALADTTPAPATLMQVYKSPTCGCCKAWIDKMRTAGFEVRVTDLDEAALQAEKARRGVSDKLASCHTAIVNGYVVEGHVPADDIRRLLKEKPAVAGLAAPGMPRGSPGMEMPDGSKDPYNVLSFTRAGKATVYARH